MKFKVTLTMEGHVEHGTAEEAHQAAEMFATFIRPFAQAAELKVALRVEPEE